MKSLSENQFREFTKAAYQAETASANLAGIVKRLYEEGRSELGDEVELTRTAHQAIAMAVKALSPLGMRSFLGQIPGIERSELNNVDDPKLRAVILTALGFPPNGSIYGHRKDMAALNQMIRIAEAAVAEAKAAGLDDEFAYGKARKVISTFAKRGAVIVPGGSAR